MSRYIVRRLTVALPTLVAVTLVVTGIMSLLPGEVVLARLLSCSSEPASSSAARTVALGAVGGAPRTGPGCYVTEEEIKELRSELGIDKSFPQRYAEWVGGALRVTLAHPSGAAATSPPPSPLVCACPGHSRSWR